MFPCFPSHVLLIPVAHVRNSYNISVIKLVWPWKMCTRDTAATVFSQYVLYYKCWTLSTVRPVSSCPISVALNWNFPCKCSDPREFRGEYFQLCSFKHFQELSESILVIFPLNMPCVSGLWSKYFGRIITPSTMCQGRWSWHRKEWEWEKMGWWTKKVKW